LRETWERREGRTLTVEGYRASGGIRGAVARSAEGVYDDLLGDDRAKLRGLMLRLLTLSPDGEPLRSAVPRGAIPEDAAHEHLVERLVQARLVTADADVLDLAHETLARAWPRLRGWLDDDIEGQRTLRHLSAAAESWHAMGRPDAELYRGDRLARAVAWQAASGADLTSHEADFLSQSRKIAQGAAAELEREASVRRRNRRRARTLVAVATTLAVIAGVAAWIALRESDQAARERDQAAAERLVASARRAAALSHAADDPATALLLAVEAVRRDDSADTRATLLSALSRSPALVRVIPGEGFLGISADGTRLYILGDGPRTVDTTSFATLAADDDALAQLLAEPGRTVFANDGVVHLETSAGEMRTIRARGMRGWDLWQATGDRTAGRIAAGFDRESPDADRYESTVVVWDARRLEDPRVRVDVGGTAAHGGIHDFALAPDGDRLYVAVPDKDEWIRAYDTDNGDLLAALPAPAGGAALAQSGRPLDAWDRSRIFIRISNDGRTLATSDGPDVVLVDPETMAVTTRLRGHTHRVIATEFSSDDRLVAASALDGSTLVWDRQTGALLERLEGIRMPVENLAFAPDSETLYGSVDGSVLVWDLAGSRRFVSTVSAPVGSFGYLVAAGPDGRSAAYFRATVTTFGRDTRFDVVTARGRRAAVPAGFANWGAYSPSGDLLATVVNSRLQVWDPRNGRLLRQTKVPGIDHVEAVTFTPDGSWVVVGDTDGSIRAVDADTLAPVGEQISLHLHLTDLVPAAEGTGVVVLVGWSEGRAWPYYVEADPATGRVAEGGLRAETQANYAAVSPDGKRLAVTQEGLAGLIDLQAGSWIAGLTDAHDETATRVDFNGDGTRFVTSGFDGRVVLWDGLTGERLAAVQPLGPDYETGVAFLPDGHTVHIAASNGQMFRWDTEPAAWLTYACQVAGRNLDKEEWSSVFGSDTYRETCPQWAQAEPSVP
jgi:WD40 repeat protein